MSDIRNFADKEDLGVEKRHWAPGLLTQVEYWTTVRKQRVISGQDVIQDPPFGNFLSS